MLLVSSSTIGNIEMIPGSSGTFPRSSKGRPSTPRARHNMSHITQRHAASSSVSMTTTSSMRVAAANRRTATRRPRYLSVAAAVVQRTGVDEPVPGGVSRTFAVDIGGASPAKVSLKYPADTTAVCIESARPRRRRWSRRLLRRRIFQSRRLARAAQRRARAGARFLCTPQECPRDT